MTGTLNANISSNNAAYAKIKALEKKLEALSSDVNVNETEIQQVQKELDEYKAQLASDFNAKNLSVTDTFDVKGTTHIEGSFTADSGATVKNTLDTNNIRINSSDGTNTTTLTPTLISTQNVSAANVTASTGNFTDLTNVSSIDTKKATIKTNNVTTENVTDLTAENVVINSDLQFPKSNSKISGEYLNIKANTVEADNLSLRKLDVGVGGINSTGSIFTSSTLSSSGDTYLNKLVVNKNIEALGDVNVTDGTITAKDLKVSGNLSSETIDTQNLNVKDLNTTTDSVDIVPGSKLLIQENGQLKTAVIKDVTSSGLDLNGYVPYNLDENTQQKQGYSLSNVSGTIISYDKNKVYTTQATYSLLNGEVVKDEDVLTGFNFVSVKDDIGLSFDTSTNTFSWVYIGLDSDQHNKGDILGTATLKTSSVKYENGSFYFVDSKVTRAFKPVMVGNAICFVDMTFSPYESFYYTKDSKNYLSINNYQWQDIPAINTTDYGINYKIYLAFDTYTTVTVYTAVTLSRNIYNSSSSTINSKKWKYAEYGGPFKLNVLYEDDTWESVTMTNTLLQLYYGDYVKDLGTDIVIYDFYNKIAKNYTVTELTEEGIKNSSYNWNSGYALESGTTVSDVTWYNSSKWSNKVTVTDSEFNVSVPMTLQNVTSTGDINGNNITAKNIKTEAITADSINISDISLDQATIKTLNSTLVNTNSVSATSVDSKTLQAANANISTRLTANSAYFPNIEIGNISSSAENVAKIEAGGYVSLLGNGAGISEVKANSVDVKTYSFIEKPSLCEDGTAVTTAIYKALYGNYYISGSQLFKMTENGPTFILELPSSTYSSVEYTNYECYLNYYTTKSSFTRVMISSSSARSETINYPANLGTIRGVQAKIYTDTGNYVYIKNKFFKIDDSLNSYDTEKVIVDGYFLFFSNRSNAAGGYYIFDSTSSDIENITSLESLIARPTLLRGWKFTLDGTTYSPDIVAAARYQGGDYIYQMVDTSTKTVSSVSSATIPEDIGVLSGYVYSNSNTSGNYAFATSIWFYNNYGCFIEASNGILGTANTTTQYLDASVPFTEDNIAFLYIKNRTLYSQYKSNKVVSIDQTGLQLKNFAIGPIKFKYIDTDYWNEMKDLLILDIKGCFYLNAAGTATETVLSFDGQTSTEIKFTTGYLTDTSSTNNVIINSSSTVDTGKYCLIVEYFEA
jgi:hypothetical protein